MSYWQWPGHPPLVASLQVETPTFKQGTRRSQEVKGANHAECSGIYGVSSDKAPPGRQLCFFDATGAAQIYRMKNRQKKL